MQGFFLYLTVQYLCFIPVHSLAPVLNRVFSSSVGKSQEVNQVARDLLFRLRKKDYDFSAADTACNASFSILRRREGDGDEKNAKNGAKESKSAKMDDVNGDEGCDNFDGKTGCVVSDSVGVSGDEKLSVVIADNEARLDPEVGCDDVGTEPAPKKAKLEDSSEKRLGPVSDTDLIPLKPKVTERVILFCHYSGPDSLTNGS